MRRQRAKEGRFWSRVDMSAGPDACWPWLGARTREYGRLGSSKANRFAWAFVNGPIPDGMQVCHSCDNPPCCNPAHLWLGTHLDNTADKVAKGREARLFGETNGQARLTEADVDAIRALVAEGRNRRLIAKDFGVSHQHVTKIVRGLRWASRSAQRPSSVEPSGVGSAGVAGPTEASGQTSRSVPPGGSPPTTSGDAALSRRDRPRTAEPFVALCRNCGGEIERGVLLPYRHVNGRPRGSVNHYARPRRPL